MSNAGVPVYFGLIPSAAQVWHDRLPDGAPTADEAAIIETLYSRTAARTVDLLSVLSAHSGEELYYRTDHHWTSLGAYYGYTALMEAMGMEPVDLADYERDDCDRPVLWDHLLRLRGALGGPGPDRHLHPGGWGEGDLLF